MAESGINGTSSGDVEMKEETTEAPLASIQAHDPTDPQPPPQAQPPIAPEHLSTIQPASIATPLAPSVATPPAASTTPAPSSRPEKPVAHGGPTRQYLNNNITPHLLEAMKYIAFYTPDKPLLWLSDFLRDRSKEIEG